MKETRHMESRAFARRCKCVFMAMLMIIMTFAFMSVTPLKANAVTGFALYILGKQVTGDNAADIMGDGNFSYNDEKKTLTIRGDLECSKPPIVPVIKNEGIEKLTIFVEKDCTLTQKTSAPCILLEKYTTITGPGVLNAVGGIRTIAVSEKLFINEANINVVNSDTDHAASAISGSDLQNMAGEGYSSLIVLNSNVTAKNEKNKQLSAIAGFRQELYISGCEALDGSKTEITVLKRGVAELVDPDGETVQNIIIRRVYNLEITGVRVNDENKADILGDGVFSYNEKTNILTINGNFQTDYNGPVIYNRIYDLTVTTASDSIIACSKNFLDTELDMTLTGNGKLTVLTQLLAIWSDSEELTIKDTDINISGRGIQCFKRNELNIINSDVVINNNNGSNALLTNGKINLVDCKLVTPEGGITEDGYSANKLCESSKVVIERSKEPVVTTTTTDFHCSYSPTATTTTETSTTSKTTTTATSTTTKTTTTTSTTTAAAGTTTAPGFSLSCEKTELEVGESVDVAILNWDNDICLLNPTMSGDSIALTPYHTPHFTVTGVKAGVSMVIVRSSSGVEKTITFTVKERQSAKKPGDANCDGLVDMSDAVLIMQAIANPNKYGVNGSDPSHITSVGWTNADVDGNGLTVGDALIIQEFLLGVRTTLGSAE